MQRSRSALTAAFNQLLLQRGYESVGPAEVADLANVGRSTFYAHYAGVDDLLAQSLDGVLKALAEGGLQTGPDPRLEGVVLHLWDNRKVARALLTGPAGAIVSRRLVGWFEAALPGFCRTEQVNRPACPLPLVAAQLAAGQLATLETWLSGRTSASPETVVQALQAGTRAAAAALIRG